MLASDINEDRGTLEFHKLLSHLSSDKHITSIKTLDTVFLDPSTNDIKWFYTNKNGGVSKKKKDSCTIANITDRFARFAQSNPFNTDGFVGILVDHPSKGSRTIMNKDELHTYLDASLSSSNTTRALLQVYLRPLRGENVIAVCDSTVTDDNDPINSIKHSIHCIDIISHTSVDTAVGNDVTSQIKAMSESIINSVKNNHHKNIGRLVFECIIDDNQHAWLSLVSTCSLNGQANLDMVETPLPRVGSASIANNITNSNSVPDESPSTKDESRSRINTTAVVVDADNSGKNRPSDASISSSSSSVQDAGGKKNPYLTTENNKPSAKKSKSKKKIDGRGLNVESGFKRSKMDEPPSIDLIAQFAAAKERIQETVHAIPAVKHDKVAQDNSRLASTEMKESSSKPEKPKKQTASKQNAPRVGQVLLPAIDQTAISTSSLIYNNSSDGIGRTESAERRIEELQKIAATTASIKSYVKQQQMLARSMPVSVGGKVPLGATVHPSSSLVVRTSSISGSEADFLARQVTSTDESSQASVMSSLGEYDALNLELSSDTQKSPQELEEDSVWSQMMHPSIYSEYSDNVSTTNRNNKGHNNNNNNNNNNSVIEKVSDTYKERIRLLEDQITLLGASIERKEAELQKKDDKLRKLVLEMDSARQEAVKDLLRQKNKFDMDMHRLKEQHAKEKSAIAIGQSYVPVTVEAPTSPDNKMRSSSSASAVSRSPLISMNPHPSTIGIESNSKLIEQIEILRNDKQRLLDSFSDERRALQAESSHKLLSLEKQLKGEVADLRRMQANLEDQLAHRSDDLNTAMSRIQSLQNINAQLEVSKQNAVEAQQRLRADLKNMQQSVQASYRLETSQGLGATADAGGTDPHTAMKLNDAKNDAKMRQLTNKLEFLKAQLDTEKKSADDARQTVQLMQAKIEEMREEHKIKMQQASTEQQKAVHDAEHQLDMRYEERMRELTTLQMKVMSMQGALSDAQEQELLSKQREENAKSMANKSAAYQASLKTEVDQLREIVSQMREEKEQEILKESGKQNQDAMVRRLDNERQYLKSQLASELTHKNELQAALNRSQQQLNEVQKQWKSDVDTLKDAGAAAEHQHSDKEQRLMQMKTQLEAELQHSQTQNNELRDGFIKMRDQVRMEQLTLENTNTIQRRLQDAYDESKAEVTRLRSQIEQNSAAHKAEIDAINESIRLHEEATQANIKMLREELSHQCDENFDAQQRIIRLKEQFNEEKLEMTKISGAENVINILKKWRNSRLFSGFRQWHTNSSLVGAARQFRDQVESVLKKNSKDLHKQKMQALNALREELNLEHEAALAAKRNEWEIEKRALLDQADAEKRLALEAAAREHEEQLKQLEADFQFDMNTLRKGKEEELRAAIARKDEFIRQLKQNFLVEFDLARKDAENQLNEAVSAKEQEMTELMNTSLANQEIDLMEKQKKLLNSIAVDHDFQMNQLRVELQMEMTTRESKLNAQHMLAIDELNAQFKLTCDEMNDVKGREMDELRLKLQLQNEEQQRQLRADMHEANEARIRELRSLWQEEFDEKSNQLRIQFDLLLTTKMEEYGKVMEIEKMRAVKLEGSKWKQAMKDANQNHELEMMKTRAEVTNLKEKEFRLELDKAMRNFELQRQLEIGEQNAFTAELKRRHALDLEKQAADHDAATDRLRIELEVSLKLKHDEWWTEKMRVDMNALEDTWKAKVYKEQKRVAQLKEDLVQQSQNFALERSNMQKQLDQSDQRILQIEAMNKAEILALRKKHFEDEEAWEARKKDELLQLDAAYEVKKQKALQELQTLCDEEMDKRLSDEHDRLQEEMDRHIGLMQDESEKLISGLEQAMGNLRNEKTGLTIELEKLTNKLEETEDTLYDLQQECKKIRQESSLTVWKAITKITQMRIRFQEGIAQFDLEAARRYEEIKRNMQAEQDAIMLAVLKLSALLQDVETARISTHTILTNHRTHELVQSRSKIQVLEKDLERLTMEKDALEEQKELIEGDIQQMESQVREIEEQIRIHNQVSSMSNGRINVAHARKKRRLDSELEHLLETIEQKRVSMTTMDRRVTEKGHERDDVEMEMIEIERKLVEIILEQQKLVMNRLDEGRLAVDKCKIILGVAQVAYPVPAEPTIEHVMQMNRNKGDDGKEQSDRDDKLDKSSIKLISYRK